MSSDREEASEGRRGFLKLIGAAAPAAAVAATGAGEAEAAEEPKTAGAGLRSTPHVEAYLASARF